MAGYVLSDDVEFSGVLTRDTKDAFWIIVDSLDLDIIPEVFDGAGLPIGIRNCMAGIF